MADPAVEPCDREVGGQPDVGRLARRDPGQGQRDLGQERDQPDRDRGEQDVARPSRPSEKLSRPVGKGERLGPEVPVE